MSASPGRRSFLLRHVHNLGQSNATRRNSSQTFAILHEKNYDLVLRVKIWRTYKDVSAFRLDGDFGNIVTKPANSSLSQVYIARELVRH